MITNVYTHSLPTHLDYYRAIRYKVDQYLGHFGFGLGAGWTR